MHLETGEAVHGLSLFLGLFLLAEHEGDNGPADLHCHPLAGHGQVVLDLDEGAELGVVVEDGEVAVLVLYLGMGPAHRDVGHAHLALVPPANLDDVLGGLQNVEVLLALVRQGLKDDVGLVLGPLDAEEVVVLSALDDGAGHGLLADLALIPCEVYEGGGVGLLHELGPHPHFQAADVDESATPLAVAGRHHEVLGGLLLHQAEAARPLQSLGHLVDPVELFAENKLQGLGCRTQHLLVVADLEHRILHPPHLEHVAHVQTVALLRPLAVLETPHYQVGAALLLVLRPRSPEQA